MEHKEEKPAKVLQGPIPALTAVSRSEHYRFEKLFKRLRRNVGQAISDYGMIEDGDKIMVCMSGGKDSYGMLEILRSLQRSAPVDFELIPVHINPGFEPGVDDGIEEYLKNSGLKYIILHKPFLQIAKEKLGPNQSLCQVCSRLRRGYLYRTYREIGATKLALGHHRDDIIATFFLNIFHNGTIKTMPPVLRNDADDVTVIRPLAYVHEKDMVALAKFKKYPITPHAACGFGGTDQKREDMMKMLRQWDKQYPLRNPSIFKALQNVAPSHLLDRDLFDFSAITHGPKVK